MTWHVASEGHSAEQKGGTYRATNNQLQLSESSAFHTLRIAHSFSLCFSHYFVLRRNDPYTPRISSYDSLMSFSGHSLSPPASAFECLAEVNSTETAEARWLGELFALE